MSGPVHRALQALAEQELHLGESIGDQSREAVRELCERVLTEFVADRANAVPVSA